MPPAPPVIKIVLPASFIIKYPNYVTIYKVAREPTFAVGKIGFLASIRETDTGLIRYQAS